MNLLVSRLRAACDAAERAGDDGTLLHAELQQLLREFEAPPTPGIPDGEDPEQMVLHLRRHIGLRTFRASKVLLHLARRPTIFHHRTRVAEAIGSSEAVLRVYIHEIRKAFRTRGWEDPIDTICGGGYSLTRDGLEIVREACRPIGALSFDRREESRLQNCLN